MFQRIVVPLDGSIRAERAIPVAARIARASGGYVVLLRVVSAATAYWPNMVAEPTMRQVAIDADLTEAEKYLSEVATCTKLDDVPTETVALYGSGSEAFLLIGVTRVGFTPCSPVARQGKHSAVALQ
jgi:nucleotide-binding universal stress UspA family protein